MFVLRPYYINSGDTVGTNHGQPYEYDTHVPLILAGTGIIPGRYAEASSPIDIATTLAVLLGTEFPPSSEGRALQEAIKK